MKKFLIGCMSLMILDVNCVQLSEFETKQLQKMNISIDSDNKITAPTELIENDALLLLNFKAQTIKNDVGLIVFLEDLRRIIGSYSNNYKNNSDEYSIQRLRKEEKSLVFVNNILKILIVNKKKEDNARALEERMNRLTFPEIERMIAERRKVV